MAMKFLPRMIACALVGTGAMVGSLAPALAADKVTFLTSWFAQAEHGGFYQAKATGLYDKAGLDVTIKMGGPQVNGSQLLLAGETDFMMGYDIQVLKGREQNLPLVTVASSFQFDLQGLMTHDDVADIAALKGKPILIAGSSRVDLLALAARQIWFHRRPDPALYLQPAAVLRRQEYRPAGLSFVRAVSGAAAERESEILSVGRWRLSALRLDDRHHRKDDRRKTRCGGPLREGLAGRLARLHEESGSRQRADQGRQSQDDRWSDRLCDRETQGEQGDRSAAMRRNWASGSSPSIATSRSTTSWSQAGCSIRRPIGKRASMSASSRTSRSGCNEERP